VRAGDLLGELSSSVSHDCFTTGSGPSGDLVGAATIPQTTLPTPGTMLTFTNEPFRGELNIAATGISTAAPTTTELTSLRNPSAFGGPVQFKASITPNAPSTGTPTGSVQFAVDGQDLGGPVPLGDGTALSPTIATLLPGTHTVTATYSGGGQFDGSSG